MPNHDELPEAAPRRLGSGSFSSGLSIPDFGACLQMGLRPVGLVQGFCAMQWGWYGAGYPSRSAQTPSVPSQQSAYVQNWYCPHGFVSPEHRAWGQNYEQTWVEAAWRQGFGSAFQRLIDEAKEVGAHGVIGVSDSSKSLTDTGIAEFHLLGTAVILESGPPPPHGEPWSTYLAGQRLAKLVEAGFMPISILATLASVRIWASCVTEYLMEGGSPLGGWASQMSGPATREVDQVSDGWAAALDLARFHARSQLDTDNLHGVSVNMSVREVGAGDQIVECTLRGTRVRRFKNAEPMPTPRPTVRLS